MDRLDEKLDKLAEDMAFIKGKMAGGQSSSHSESILSRQNGITVAIAGLITTVGTVLTSIFVGK